ncbi:MAG: GAF domain-containing protein, partial [Flavobacteriaceae bacterium]|nr:GAF domain-containing protein [Flavobacteriaceae bacterium]
MKNSFGRTTPFKLYISFNKLMEFYEKQLHSDDKAEVEKAQRILDAQKPYPILRKGVESVEELEKHRDVLDVILQDLFASPLSKNEIKMATLPFQNYRFYSTKRFRKILNEAGEDFQLQINHLSDDEYYKVASTVILRAVHGFDISYKRSFIYQIPDSKGITRHYKILYNADFIEIEKGQDAPEVSKADFQELLDNFDDIELWKTKIPPHSYIFKGFIIANMFDVTDDQSISNIKTTLISDGKRKDKDFIKNFRNIFRSLLGIEDLEVGFSTFNAPENSLNRVFGEDIQSFLLNQRTTVDSSEVLCNVSYDVLMKKKEYYSISDVDHYYQLSKGKSPQYATLKAQGYKSAILAPIANGDQLLGILELVSKKPLVLHGVNAHRLTDVMPFIVSSVERSKAEQENLVEAIIQQECTSVHSSVKWKFEEAALEFIQEEYKGNKNPQFRDIVINDVYPLYGQIDVKGSSGERNEATRKDLLLQLSLLRKIFENILQVEPMPFYEQVAHQILSFEKELEENFKVDSEKQVYDFVVLRVNPILEFVATKHHDLKSEINEYFSKIDSSVNLIYYHRKKFDQTISLINKRMSSFLDRRQKEAQAIYPHYFERYKTDGVEHNMYIGNQITKQDDFNEVYLYNLRLWQLQVMCEMENEYYQNQDDYPLSLDVTSMILVFGQPLSIRFRMDEKKFDVDGTYNARYEVVKKRVDKAFIKGTEERITQKGKITIVYSQKEDELEYRNYISFLQSKKILDQDVEIVQLQDLQGLTGLKALRVSVLYHNP